MTDLCVRVINQKSNLLITTGDICQADVWTIYRVERLPGREEAVCYSSEELPVDKYQRQKWGVEEVESQEDGAVPEKQVGDSDTVA